MLSGGLIRNAHYQPVVRGPGITIWINIIISKCRCVGRNPVVRGECASAAVIRLAIGFLFPRVCQRLRSDIGREEYLGYMRLSARRRRDQVRPWIAGAKAQVPALQAVPGPELVHRQLERRRRCPAR